MKENEQLIGEILLDQLPKNILEALRVMASLTYPVSDQRSFIDQLETLGKGQEKSPSAEQVEALDFVRGTLTALDFPILTPVSGLEKIFTYFSDPYWEDSLPGSDIPEEPVNICMQLRSAFPGECGHKAFHACVDAYSRAPARFAFTAGLQAGMAEGQRCMNSGGFLDLDSAWDPRDIDWWDRYRRGAFPGRPRRFRSRFFA